LLSRIANFLYKAGAYLTAGVPSTLSYWLVVVLLSEKLAVWYWLCVTVSWAISRLAHFITLKYFTFQDFSPTHLKSKLWQYIKVSLVFDLGVKLVLIAIMVYWWGLPKYHVDLAVSFGITIAKYLPLKRIFRQ
jgi:putative flippase GtrA